MVCKMTTVVTLWQANEGLKVLSLLHIKIFWFFSNPNIGSDVFGFLREFTISPYKFRRYILVGPYLVGPNLGTGDHLSDLVPSVLVSQ